MTHPNVLAISLILPPPRWPALLELALPLPFVERRQQQTPKANLTPRNNSRPFVWFPMHAKHTAGQETAEKLTA
uniref:Uncharacterized protein n=1 Tax=Anguilla anguilla TaxID=7936 RepID=A0A0E9QRK3_ANGAN